MELQEIVTITENSKILNLHYRTYCVDDETLL